MNKQAPGSTGAKTPEFYTVPELADFLRVSPATIYRYVEQRLISFVSLPRGLRFRKADVEEFLTRQRVPSLHENVI